MKKFILSFNLLALIVLAGLWTSCNKESDELTAEEDILGVMISDLETDDIMASFAEIQDIPQDAFDVEATPGHRPHKCFSFNYPVTVMFADETSFTVNSKEELRDALIAWKEQNPGMHPRPQLVFPVSITMRDGTVKEIGSREEMREVIFRCNMHWRHVRLWTCVDLVFPVTLVFPDETTLIVNSKEELKNALLSWKENNTDIEGRPRIQFPFDVQLKNGNIVTINDLDELKRLIKQCIKKRRFIRF